MALTVATSALAAPVVRKASASATSSASVVEARAEQRGTAKNRVKVPMTRKSGTNVFAKVRNAQPGHKSPVKVRSVAGQAESVLGSLVYTGDESAEYGVYNVPLTAGGSMDLAQAIEMTPTSAWYADGKYYNYIMLSFWGFYLGTQVDVYDATTWEQLSSVMPEVDYLTPFDPKQNPADGKVYTSATDGESYLWGTMDLYSNQFTTITETDYVAAGLVIKDGVGYGVTPEGALLKIDLATGAATTIGETGIGNVYLTGAYYDSAADKMYYANNTDEEAAMWCVDLTTAEAQKLYDFAQGEEFVGLFTPTVKAPGAPADPTEVTVVPDGGSLTYTVKVTAPTTCTDGSELSAEGLVYNVSTSGQEFTGSIAPGETVSVTATAPHAGYTSARATMQNAEGQSFGVVGGAFVGPDVLTEVSGVTLAYGDAGKLVLSWTAPEPVHDGYFDPSQLSYTVTDAVSGETVASGLTETTLEIPYTASSELTVYQYAVTANYMGADYEAVVSNSITMGSLEPPFSADFNDAGDMGKFTVLDGNGDGKLWTWYEDTNTGDSKVRIGYNGSEQMDDWLVLPGLKLEAGKAYKFSVDAAAGSTSYSERIEVKMGSACTPEAMTTELVAPTDLTGKDFVTLTAAVNVPETGVYYIGIHGISDPDKLYLYVDNVKVSGALDGNAPAVATNVTATAAADGSNAATVSFTAPSVNIAGQPVGTLTQAVVSRADGSVVGTVEAPVAGQTYSVTDNAATTGNNTYRVVVSNEAGSSDVAEVTVYVGFTVPADLTPVTAVEVAEGEVNLSWEGVTTDANGLPLPAGSVTYSVYTLDGSGRSKVAEGITDTNYTYTAIEPGSQTFMQWAVFPVSAQGEGAGNVSDLIAVGTPYTTPMNESFANKGLSYSWMLGAPNPDGEMEAALGDDATFQGLTSQDLDNGFIYFQGSYLDDAVSLISGKIAIPAGQPTLLSFYNLGITTDGGNEVTTSVICDGVQSALGTCVALGDFEWQPISYDLSDWAGKNVQIVLSVRVTALKYTMLDNIKVATPRYNDLAALKLNAPAKVQAGSDVNVTAVVENRGIEDAVAYTVDFYMNGNLLTTVERQFLDAGEKTDVTATVATTPLTADELTFYAVVNRFGDEDTANNTTAAVTTTVVKTDLPAPTALMASALDGKVKLDWDACSSMASSAETATESFENGNAGDMTYEGWSFVDLDQSPVGGMQNTEIPGIAAGQSLASFFVWDASSGLAKVSAHSGNKCLAALFRYDGGTTNDWMVSPTLSGNEQTVSFYAMSYSSSYPEKMEVYYTTGSSTDPADFTKVTAFGTKTIKSAWTQYSFQLPAGATRFALRSCATDSFMLLVDDVTYERGSAAVNLQGYNVYCNGNKVNEATVETNSYVDVPTAATELVYNVTAVYDRGESRPSNEARIEFNGVGNLAAGLTVVAVNNEIVVRGAAGAQISVIAPDGKTVAARQGVDSARIKVANGVYLVTVGQRTVKVAVK